MKINIQHDPNITEAEITVKLEEINKKLKENSKKEENEEKEEIFH